jgi:hypothetical protein
VWEKSGGTVDVLSDIHLHSLPIVV